MPGSYGEGDEIDLPDDEARHLSRVLRLEAGAVVRVFDGHGREFTAVVTRTTKTLASVRIAAAQAPVIEPRVAITLAHAVLKGDKMDDVIRDAVMIGAAAVQPIVSTRTEVTLGMLERTRRGERWSRVAVSSAKQCGRAVVPPILTPVTFDSLLATLEIPTPAHPPLMLVEPSADYRVLSLAELDAVPPPSAMLVIGPEGGWTPDEVERAAPVCRLVRLGGRTVRADAMATVAIAALFAKWGEY